MCLWSWLPQESWSDVVGSSCVSIRPAYLFAYSGCIVRRIFVRIQVPQFWIAFVCSFTTGHISFCISHFYQEHRTYSFYSPNRRWFLALRTLLIRKTITPGVKLLFQPSFNLWRKPHLNPWDGEHRSIERHSCPRGRKHRGRCCNRPFSRYQCWYVTNICIAAYDFNNLQMR